MSPFTSAAHPASGARSAPLGLPTYLNSTFEIFDTNPDLTLKRIKARVHQPGGPKFTLEATRGRMDSFCSQLPYKCRLEEVASVGD